MSRRSQLSHDGGGVQHRCRRQIAVRVFELSIGFLSDPPHSNAPNPQRHGCAVVQLFCTQPTNFDKQATKFERPALRSIRRRAERNPVFLARRTRPSDHCWVQRRSFVHRDTSYPARSRLRSRRSPLPLSAGSARESASLLPAIVQTHAQILRDVVEKLKETDRHRPEADNGEVEPASDADLAKSAARALEADDFVPFEDLDLTVSNGRITLRGRVEWPYQKDDAERIVGRLPGVKRVSNRITVNVAGRPRRK